MATQAHCADCGTTLVSFPWLTSEVRPKLLVFCATCGGGEMYDYEVADRDATVPRPDWLRRPRDARPCPIVPREARPTGPSR
jgi:hypothetical protein